MPSGQRRSGLEVAALLRRYKLAALVLLTLSLEVELVTTTEAGVSRGRQNKEEVDQPSYLSLGGWTGESAGPLFSFGPHETSGGRLRPERYLP